MLDLKKLVEWLQKEKILQYGMASLLLVSALVLPEIALRRAGRESSAMQAEAVQGESAQNTQGSGMQGASGESAQNTQESGMQGASGERAQNMQGSVVQGASGVRVQGTQGDDAQMSQNGAGDFQTGESGGATEKAGERGTVVLDAGHGGDDPGMIGSSGINEKVLNLVYAKKVEALLSEAGYRVVMTRTTEDGLYDADASHKKAQDMQRRVAVIEQEQPLLTVSIHQNSYQDPAVCGPQVFYYEHSTEGEKLAKSIQDSLNEELAIARPRVQKGNATYYILKRSRSTTVIVECGFLSNPEEEAKLQEEDYQDQVAQAICDGVRKYLEE